MTGQITEVAAPQEAEIQALFTDTEPINDRSISRDILFLQIIKKVAAL